ncbi:hypothetical protein ES703_60283 [subsurface metagenome]
MEENSVKFIFIGHIFNVALFEILVSDNEDFRVGPGHTHKGIFRIKRIEDPAVAVSRGHNGGPQINEELSQVSQFTPDGHTFPVKAEFLSLYSSIFVINFLL